MLQTTSKEVLISADQIQKRVAELGAQISKDYQGEQIVAACVLKGAFIFAADLVRHIEGVAVTMDFMAVSSYGAAAQSSGVVKILKDLDTDIGDKHLLLIEDIVDSGLTLYYLSEVMRARSPKSFQICALFDKPSGRKADVSVAYAGFEVPGRFIVGYGLDYNQQYRNLPYIACLD